MRNRRSLGGGSSCCTVLPFDDKFRRHRGNEDPSAALNALVTNDSEVIYYKDLIRLSLRAASRDIDVWREQKPLQIPLSTLNAFLRRLNSLGFSRLALPFCTDFDCEQILPASGSPSGAVFSYPTGVVAFYCEALPGGDLSVQPGFLRSVMVSQNLSPYTRQYYFTLKPEELSFRLSSPYYSGSLQGMLVFAPRVSVLV